MAAGSYSTCFEWAALSYGTADQYGEKPRTLTSQGNVWGRWDSRTGYKADHLGSPTNTQTATVRLREHLPLKIGDTLTDLEHDEAWTVEGVSRDDAAYETVAEVQRLR